MGTPVVGHGSAVRQSLWHPVGGNPVTTTICQHACMFRSFPPPKHSYVCQVHILVYDCTAKKTVHPRMLEDLWNDTSPLAPPPGFEPYMIAHCLPPCPSATPSVGVYIGRMHNNGAANSQAHCLGQGVMCKRGLNGGAGGPHQRMQVREERSLGRSIVVVGPVLAARSKTSHQALPHIVPCNAVHLLRRMLIHICQVARGYAEPLPLHEQCPNVGHSMTWWTSRVCAVSFSSHMAYAMQPHCISPVGSLLRQAGP